MRETLESIQTYPGVIFKIVDGQKIIGAGRVQKKGTVVETNKLIVHPKYQGKGWGHKLLEACENTYLETDFYEIYTGEKSARNIHLYESHGYVQTGPLKKDGDITIIGLKKANPLRLRLLLDPKSIKSYADYKLIWAALPELQVECISATTDCKYKTGDIRLYRHPYEKPADFCEALCRVLDLYTWRAALGFPSWNEENPAEYLIHCPDSQGTVWRLKAK
jgi:GNAT superfamily N-acetyltransferase